MRSFVTRYLKKTSGNYSRTAGKVGMPLTFVLDDTSNFIFLQRTTNVQLLRCSAIQFYLSHRHVSVTLVTIFRVSYSKNTSNMLVITQNVREKYSKIRVN
jgi:hypothetical protein